MDFLTPSRKDRRGGRSVPRRRGLAGMILFLAQRRKGVGRPCPHGAVESVGGIFLAQRRRDVFFWRGNVLIAHGRRGRHDFIPRAEAQKGRASLSPGRRGIGGRDIPRAETQRRRDVFFWRGNVLIAHGRRGRHDLFLAQRRKEEAYLFFQFLGKYIKTESSVSSVVNPDVSRKAVPVLCGIFSRQGAKTQREKHNRFFSLCALAPLREIYQRLTPNAHHSSTSNCFSR